MKIPILQITLEQLLKESPETQRRIWREALRKGTDIPPELIEEKVDEVMEYVRHATIEKGTSKN